MGIGTTTASLHFSGNKAYTFHPDLVIHLEYVLHSVRREIIYHIEIYFIFPRGREAQTSSALALPPRNPRDVGSNLVGALDYAADVRFGSKHRD